MLSKNQEITVEIQDVTLKGDGIGKIDGFVIFIPNSFVGDIVKVQVIKVDKSFARGKILEILTPSPFRIEIDCKCFEKCGGCAFRNVSYEAELKLKQKIVTDTFQRIGNIQIRPDPILPSVPDYYRNKVSYPVAMDGEKAFFGFYTRHSNRIVPHTHCYIQNEDFYKIAKEIVDFCNDKNITILRHIVIRKGFHSGEISVCLVVSKKTKAFEDLKIPHILNVNNSTGNAIFGEKFIGESIITDTICDNKIFLTPDSFYQVNTPQAEKISEIIKDFIQPKGDETVLDLYCGVGTISMYLAKFCKNVIGVECVKNAVKNARRGKYANKIENVEFICKNVEDFDFCFEEKISENLQINSDISNLLECDVESFKKFLEDKKSSGNFNLRKAVETEISKNEKNSNLAIVLDPPRTGCSCVPKIAKFGAKRIVMVSCDVATAARDCKIFEENGYATAKIQPVDMFPRTGNVECVIGLTKITR
jgi:23S rRNA (uracil1939-C5)-methyltransferase